MAAASECSEAEVLVQLDDLNERIRQMFPHSKDKKRNDAVTSDKLGSWKADGIAGIIRLNSRVELEIVPKFLDKADPTWRQDFFVLAVLVKTGHLLQYDEISVASATRDDLATLVALSLVALCEDGRRRPLRNYLRTASQDFAVEGDVDAESIVLPDSDGYRISRLELSGRNRYNATISAAARVLLREVGDVDTQDRLRQLIRTLGPQDAAPREQRSVPQRHQHWAEAHSLSLLILEGLGLDYQSGMFTGPGFIIQTWEAWQIFCEEIVRRSLRDYRVIGQRAWELGAQDAKSVPTKPDISVLREDVVQFLLDAKYRTRLSRSPSIGQDDLYESFAFLHAAEVNRLELLYPATESLDTLAVGEWRYFDDIRLRGDKRIRGVVVQIRGLSRRGGIEAIIRHATLKLERLTRELHAEGK
ncbi:hypothetical protein C5C69_06580 [Rathayibacter sp. AY1C7]|uniref:5-methylcytosine restriction system specificity protein McrC n=1 Tax=Rathayibacter sp. AY1C7 TaxID=2080540 RepID=UPI000CE8C155|nr:hypothetical protein [Rathayibacter sp. AY1C7]PPG61974.1 hypothetical protein C5C69_06580 [Rathayibacter sp. AY1C7]